MLAKVLSSAVLGIEAYLIKVEVDISAGLPTFNIVGLPDTSVRESRDRVMAAIKNSELEFPTKRITVNLAPADIKKEGASFDLAIALGILAAHGQIQPENLKDHVFLGELALDGTIRGVKGVLPITVGLRDTKIKGIFVPHINRQEASLAESIKVYPLANLRELVLHMNKESAIKPHQSDIGEMFNVNSQYGIDFSDVKGQLYAKRSLEIAAAGGHNILLVGPPGSGKTMLAKRLTTILPDMVLEESIETTKIHSVVGNMRHNQALIATRPFRSPHHTISDVALIGGGAYPKPGEVSLAHNGVLFLDELPEFHRNVLEVLRQPLEDGVVTISRAQSSLTFPAKFMLVAAMNPCPCGYNGDPKQECICSVFKIQKYMSRISGPLLDRIDMHIDVPRLKYDEITQEVPAENSAIIRSRVNAARAEQRERFGEDKNVYCNAHMQARHIRKYCKLTPDSQELLKHAINKLNLSARAYDRILKVARTIADLEGLKQIQAQNISEALQYRGLDKNLFN